MKKRAIYSTGIVMMLLTCLGIIGSSVTAGSRQHAELSSLTMNKLTEADFEGLTTHVSIPDGFLVVGGQIRVPVVESLTLRSGELINTVILDEKGGQIPLSQIKKYQRVHVYGYRTDAGFVFANKIKRLALRPGDKAGPNTEPE